MHATCKFMKLYLQAQVRTCGCTNTTCPFLQLSLKKQVGKKHSKKNTNNPQNQTHFFVFIQMKISILKEARWNLISIFFIGIDDGITNHGRRKPKKTRELRVIIGIRFIGIRFKEQKWFAWKP